MRESSRKGCGRASKVRASGAMQCVGLSVASTVGSQRVSVEETAVRARNGWRGVDSSWIGLEQRRAMLDESSLALRELWLRAGTWDVALARLSVAVVKSSIEGRSRRVVRDSSGQAVGWGGVAVATAASDVELVEVVARARSVWAR